ncbi:hypothetical protein U3A55_07015 [Salarchaeum sp. III]|uniref:hypothetical protein n=1 Tax=Salarchaeum sp. III TaxID=3107927 RepID=UPI002ED9831D
MGLKSGSRDAGLDDEEAESNEREAEAGEQSEPTTSEVDNAVEAADASGSEGEEAGDDRPSMSSIPYKLRRDKVNEGREQVPYFLREEVIAGEDDLQAELEDLLDEKVYKSDYREAAMVVAQRNPDLIADVLREWGYDLE